MRRRHFRMKCQWESGRNLSMTCSAPPSFPIPMLLLCPLRRSLPRSTPDLDLSSHFSLLVTFCIPDLWDQAQDLATRTLENTRFTQLDEERNLRIPHCAYGLEETTDVHILRGIFCSNACADVLVIEKLAFKFGSSTLSL